VQIDVRSDGRISLVDLLSQEEQLQVNSKAQFSVHWDDGYPTSAGGCAPGCSVPDGTTNCLCPITMDEGAVYTDEDYVPTPAELHATLVNAAFDIDMYEAENYIACSSAACAANADVTVYSTSDQWDATTIFALPSKYGTGTVYLLNRQSTVRVGSFSFRNPVHFMPLLGNTKMNLPYWTNMFGDFEFGNAEAETDALLTHLFEHKNTAPFVAHRMIQRLVTSNPSPRYVKAAADAFRTGAYDGTTYSGEYGDMGALFAAIVLDR
jgi:hypothetical protein